jgi:hypothetical protein
VRRGEHRARSVERAGGVVQHVCRRQSEVDDIQALLHHAPREIVGELLARPAHVACDEHPIGITECGESDSESMRDLAVELIGHRPPDVVRLDYFIQN